MAYVNTGQSGFNDAIKKESASIKIGDKQYNFYWHKYVTTDSDGAKFIKLVKGDALPVPVNAGSVEAHETAFSPDPIQGKEDNYGENFVSYEEFEALAKKQSLIIATFRFETFSGKAGSVQCQIIIDKAFIFYAGNGWIAPGCSDQMTK